jgi:hypothetical protein
LSQKAGLIIDASGGNHVSYSMVDTTAATSDTSHKDRKLLAAYVFSHPPRA